MRQPQGVQHPQSLVLATRLKGCCEEKVTRQIDATIKLKLSIFVCKTSIFVLIVIRSGRAVERRRVRFFAF